MDNSEMIVQRLLLEWKLEEYADGFQEAGIESEEDLAGMNLGVVVELIPERAKELTFWRQWVLYFKNKIQLNAAVHEQERVEELPANQYVPVGSVTYNKTVLFTKITKSQLEEILKNHKDTRAILDKLKKNDKFDHNDASRVTDRIVEYLIDNYGADHWDHLHYENIAKNLASLLSSSISMFWCDNNGKIYQKFKNYAHTCAQLEGIAKKRGRKSAEIQINIVKRPRLEQDGQVDAAIKWLKEKHVGGELKKIMEKWHLTFEWRSEFMKINKWKSITDIYKEWPILVSPIHGKKLILSDFQMMKENLNVKGNIDEDWEPFFDYILSNNTRLNKQIKGLIDISNSTTTTEGGKMMLQISILAYFYSIRGNAKMNEKSNEGITVTKSIGTIVQHAKTAADVEPLKASIIEKAGTDSVQPYIIAINGNDLNEATGFMVILDQHEYVMTSGKDAIDFCFKIFHTLSAEYPFASRHLWRMIEIGVYKFKNGPFNCPSYFISHFEDLEKKYL